MEDPDSQIVIEENDAIHDEEKKKNLKNSGIKEEDNEIIMNPEAESNSLPSILETEDSSIIGTPSGAFSPKRFPEIKVSWREINDNHED